MEDPTSKHHFLWVQGRQGSMPRRGLTKAFRALLTMKTRTRGLKIHLPMQDPSLPIFSSPGGRPHKPLMSFPSRHLTDSWGCVISADLPAASRRHEAWKLSQFPKGETSCCLRSQSEKKNFFSEWSHLVVITGRCDLKWFLIPPESGKEQAQRLYFHRTLYNFRLVGSANNCHIYPRLH